MLPSDKAMNTAMYKKKNIIEETQMYLKEKVYYMDNGTEKANATNTTNCTNGTNCSAETARHMIAQWYYIFIIALAIVL
jgi:hypothetical protein